MTLGLGLGPYAAAQDAGSEVNPCAATPDASPTDLIGRPPNATPMTIPGLGPATPMASPPATVPCPSPEAESAADDVVVEFVDIAVIPREVTIPADTDVPFRFVNTGGLQHNFKIDHPEAFSGHLHGGQSSEVVVNRPTGDYACSSTIPGHKEAGMVGTLIVKELAAQ